MSIFSDAFSAFGSNSGPFVSGSGLGVANGAIMSGNEGAFPVFDSSGRMLGNITSIQGIGPTSNVLNETGPFQSSTAYFQGGGNNAGNTLHGSTIISPQANSTSGSGGILIPGIQGSVINAPGATANPNTGNANPIGNGTATPAASTAPVAGSLADYFARAIIIILGFIFIAVGLNMLRPGTVPIPTRRV